jgi:uncharacterized protein YndB with AHSA1/START domain
VAVTDRIERDVVVAVPPERLWEVLTRPEHIREWFMDSEVDLRPGGAIVLTSEEFGKIHAVVEKVDPPRTFSYRWARHPDVPVAEGTATLVEFTLTPEGDSTRLRVVETGFASTDAVKVDQERHAQANRQGWLEVLDAIRRHAEQRTS